MIGHDRCLIINETNTHIETCEIEEIVRRIAEDNEGNINIIYKEVAQDTHLAENQAQEIRCGDNGIFKGMPETKEQKALTGVAKRLYEKYNSDGKYILDGAKLIICQSNANSQEIEEHYKDSIINPLGEWSGGINVDSGATNRKLGSDMGDSITGGGLHGKDLSKADVSVNIYAWLKAQKTGKEIKLCCAIGDKEIDGKPYSEIVEIARNYIKEIGGFEKFAEWGLIR